ncbi:MAG: GNAT family N-acetyltransferase [Paracoccaceae bacterium]|nr:GNAT family N-acetyltransferase [Paracoccaceae bacterium]
MLPISRARPDYPHWDVMLALILDAFTYMEGRIDPPSSAHRLTVEAMAAQAASGMVWVIEDGGRPIACAFGKLSGEALYLGKIAVAQGYRGRGLARRLIEKAASEARAKGRAWLELESRIELAENHAAFGAMGFVKTGETAHPGYDQSTSITMRRPIGRRGGVAP